MAAHKKGGVLLYSTSVISLTVLVGYVLGILQPELNIVTNPLLVTKICCLSLAILQTGGIYWLQGSYHIKKWQPVKGFLLVVLGSLFFHVVTVLYGAYVLESVAETYHFACLLSVLTILPPCVGLGINNDTWLRVYAHSRPESSLETLIRLTTLFSLIGAWLGAFPIPLDWDRPWQAWPITCVSGALLGNMFGHIWFSYASSNKSQTLPKSKTR